jgi:GT2 family glycosyltransferase
MSRAYLQFAGTVTATQECMQLTIAIPTYGREQVLIDTIRYLLELEPEALEILIVDQTAKHEPNTDRQLASWNETGEIRWLRRDVPSIPQAMNHALLEAKGDIVLFLDDDIRPDPQLLKSHLDAHASRRGDAACMVLVAGRVLQPWHVGVRFPAHEAFHFACLESQYVSEFMGGNFSVKRWDALSIGGFDENFVKVAYRFESEFASRIIGAGGKIWYSSHALIYHLKDASGGTRAYGEHLTTWRPDHAVGAYYFALLTGKVSEVWRRPFRSVATRFHLRHPWRIVPTLVAEIRGLVWACRLRLGGPKTIKRAS